jgi:hypothetical protein
MDGNGSWPVHGLRYKESSYLLGRGWRQFCQENRLKEGDICIFNVIETTLWNVVITGRKEKMNQFCYVSYIHAEALVPFCLVKSTLTCT